MKIAPMAEVKADPSAYVKASEAELVVVTRNGKPVAVLLPMADDAECERRVMAKNSRTTCLQQPESAVFVHLPTPMTS